MKRFALSIGIVISPLLCGAIICLIVSCRPAKSDQEQILDVLNGYLETQAKGEYEKSYKYLAPQTQKEISERDWVMDQLKSLNSAKLMREPRLANVMVKGDTATADFQFRGIPGETLANVISQIYSRNFTSPKSDINRACEEYLTEHFNELASPQTMALVFVKTREGWRLLLDAKGKPRKLE